MKNKRHFFSILVIGFFTSNILNSCQSQEKNKNEAFESFRAKKKMLKDCLAIQKSVLSKDKDLLTERILKKSIKIETILKVKVMDDWTKFKTESEKKITDNESKIKQIKGIPDVSVNYSEKLSRQKKQTMTFEINYHHLIMMKKKELKYLRQKCFEIYSK